METRLDRGEVGLGLGMLDRLFDGNGWTMDWLVYGRSWTGQGKRMLGLDRKVGQIFNDESWTGNGMEEVGQRME